MDIYRQQQQQRRSILTICTQAKTVRTNVYSGLYPIHLTLTKSTSSKGALKEKILMTG